MMQPPISHYKDEPVDQTTESLVNQEIDKELAAQAEGGEATAKLKVLPVQNEGGKKSKESSSNPSNIVNAFRQKLAASSMVIDLPSIGRKLAFKDITTSEQKEIAKVSLESGQRADVMFTSMVGLINRLAVDKDFDIRDCTEFERIAITLNLQQMNKLNPEIKYTCATCGKENSYRLDTTKMLRKFNKSYVPDKEFEVEIGGRKFTFTAGWPSVRAVEAFFKNYYKKYDASSKNVKETIDNLSQVEYITMFLKKITIVDDSDPEDSLTANLEDLTYPERVQIIDCLPQMVLFDDDIGVVDKVLKTFVNPMNESFKYNDCAYCGAEQEGTMASLTDFLGA